MHIHGSLIDGIPHYTQSDVHALGVSVSRFEAGLSFRTSRECERKAHAFLYPILRLIVSETSYYYQS